MSANDIEVSGESGIFDLPTQIGPWELENESTANIVWRRDIGDTDLDPQDGERKPLYEYVIAKTGPHGGSWRGQLRKGFADTTMLDRPVIAEFEQGSRTDDGRDQVLDAAIEFMKERAREVAEAAGSDGDQAGDGRPDVEVVEDLIQAEGGGNLDRWERVDPDDNLASFDNEVLAQWEDHAGKIAVYIERGEHSSGAQEGEPYYEAGATSVQPGVEYESKSLEYRADTLETAVESAIGYMRRTDPTIPLPTFSMRMPGGTLKPLMEFVHRLGGGKAYFDVRQDGIFVESASFHTRVDFFIASEHMRDFQVDAVGEFAVDAAGLWGAFDQFKFGDEVSLALDASEDRPKLGVGPSSIRISLGIDYIRRPFPEITAPDFRFTVPGLRFKDTTLLLSDRFETGALGVTEGKALLHAATDAGDETVTIDLEAVDVFGEGFVTVPLSEWQTSPLNDLRRALPRPSRNDLKFTVQFSKPLLVETAVDDKDAPGPGVDVRVALAEESVPVDISPPPEEITVPEEADVPTADEGVEAALEQAVEEAAEDDEPTALDSGFFEVTITVEEATTGLIYAPPVGEMSLAVEEEIADAFEAELGPAAQYNEGRVIGTALITDDDVETRREFVRIAEIRVPTDEPEEEPEEEPEAEEPPPPPDEPEEEPITQSILVSLIGGSKNYNVPGRVPGAVEDEVISAARDTLGPPGEFDVNDQVGDVTFRGGDVLTIDLDAGRKMVGEEPERQTVGELVVGAARLDVPAPHSGWESVHFVNRNLDNEPREGDRVVYVSPDRTLTLRLDGTRVSNKWGMRLLQHDEPLPEEPSDAQLLFGPEGHDSESEFIRLTSGNVVDGSAEKILRDNFPPVEEARERFGAREERLSESRAEQAEGEIPAGERRQLDLSDPDVEIGHFVRVTFDPVEQPDRESVDIGDVTWVEDGLFVIKIGDDRTVINTDRGRVRAWKSGREGPLRELTEWPANRPEEREQQTGPSGQEIPTQTEPIRDDLTQVVAALGISNVAARHIAGGHETIADVQRSVINTDDPTDIPGISENNLADVVSALWLEDEIDVSAQPSEGEREPFEEFDTPEWREDHVYVLATETERGSGDFIYDWENGGPPADAEEVLDAIREELPPPGEFLKETGRSRRVAEVTWEINDEVGEVRNVDFEIIAPTIVDVRIGPSHGDFSRGEPKILFDPDDISEEAKQEIRGQVRDEFSDDELEEWKVQGGGPVIGRTWVHDDGRVEPMVWQVLEGDEREWERAVEYLRDRYDDTFGARTELGAELSRFANEQGLPSPAALGDEGVLQPIIRYQDVPPEDVFSQIEGRHPENADDVAQVIIAFAEADAGPEPEDVEEAEEAVEEPPEPEPDPEPEPEEPTPAVPPEEPPEDPGDPEEAFMEDMIELPVEVDDDFADGNIYSVPPQTVPLDVARQVDTQMGRKLGPANEFSRGTHVGTAFVTPEPDPQNRSLVRTVAFDRFLEQDEPEPDLTRSEIETIVENATAGVTASAQVMQRELREITLRPTARSAVDFPRDEVTVIRQEGDNSRDVIHRAVDRWDGVVDFDSIDREERMDINRSREALNEQYEMGFGRLAAEVPPPEEDEFVDEETAAGFTERDIETFLELATDGVEATVSIFEEADSLRISFEEDPVSDVVFAGGFREVQGQASAPGVAIRDALEMWEENVQLDTVNLEKVNANRNRISRETDITLDPIQPGLPEGIPDDIEGSAVERFITVQQGITLEDIDEEALVPGGEFPIPVSIEQEVAEMIEGSSRAEFEPTEVLMGGAAGERMRQEHAMEGVKQVQQGLQVHLTDAVKEDVHAALAELHDAEPDKFYDSTDPSSLEGYDWFWTFTLTRDEDDDPWTVPRFKPSEMFELLEPHDGQNIKVVALAGPLV